MFAALLRTDIPLTGGIEGADAARHQAVGATRLAADDLAELKPYGLQSSTPLWYYVLKEAEQVADGLRLGPVGGRVVAEVLIGLLETDSNSYLARKPKWTLCISISESKE